MERKIFRDYLEDGWTLPRWRHTYLACFIWICFEGFFFQLKYKRPDVIGCIQLMNMQRFHTSDCLVLQLGIGIEILVDVFKQMIRPNVAKNFFLSKTNVLWT